MIGGKEKGGREPRGEEDRHMKESVFSVVIPFSYVNGVFLPLRSVYVFRI